MKAFEEKHEVIFNYDFYPIDSNCEDGKETPHKASVQSINFFTNIEENVFKRMTIDKSFIIDVYNKIQEIEKEEINKVHRELPF